VTFVDGSALPDSGLLKLTIEPNCLSLDIFGCFLLSRDHSSLVLSFGGLAYLVVPSFVERLCHHCFAFNDSSRVIAFEVGSLLSRIESRAFCACPSLESIVIPFSVRIAIDLDSWPSRDSGRVMF
jgi:hypothetical protein